MAPGPSERDRALALLRDQHAFPGEFSFRVVIHPPARPAIVSAVAATLVAPEAVLEVTERASRHGKYLALHLKVWIGTPERVLEIYEVLKGVDGVLTVM